MVDGGREGKEGAARLETYHVRSSCDYYGIVQERAAWLETLPQVILSLLFFGGGWCATPLA
jgi:hypothetical protein